MASPSPWQANIFKHTRNPERTCKQPTSPSPRKTAGGEESEPRVERLGGLQGSHSVRDVASYMLFCRSASVLRPGPP